MKKINWNDFVDFVGRSGVHCKYPGKDDLYATVGNRLVLVDFDEAVPDVYFYEQEVSLPAEEPLKQVRLVDTKGRTYHLAFLITREATLADVLATPSLEKDKYTRHTLWKITDANGDHLDTVCYVCCMTADEVKRSLVAHDGFDESIKVEPAVKMETENNK